MGYARRRRLPMRSSDLKNLTDGELAAEVERRAKLANHPPKPLPNPDFSKLKKYVIEVTEDLARGEMPKDYEHYIYEAAIEAVYGKKYWAWMNKQDL